MTKHILLLSGNPGVGKTTVLLKTVETLRDMGFSIGGMLSREVREGGTRVGFEILDLRSPKRGWLAHVNQESGPQVGKYRVNLEDLNTVGAEAIIAAIENCDVIAIDEIGQMELFSEKFKQAAKMAVESAKNVIAIVHWKAKDRLVEEVKERGDAEMYVVSYENRENLHEVIAKKLFET